MLAGLGLAGCSATLPEASPAPPGEVPGAAAVLGDCRLGSGSLFEILDIGRPARSRITGRPLDCVARFKVNGKLAGTGQDCAREFAVVLHDGEPAAPAIVQRMFDVIAEHRPDRDFLWRSPSDHKVHVLSTRTGDRVQTEAQLVKDMFPAWAGSVDPHLANPATGTCVDGTGHHRPCAQLP